MNKLMVCVMLLGCGSRMGFDGDDEKSSYSGDEGDHREGDELPGEPADSADDGDVPGEEPAFTWLQLSTDDSTSMASAQLYKAGLGYLGLFAHEFLNYYDPPRALFEQEPWAVRESPEGLELGTKAVSTEAGLELLFELRAPPVDHATRRPWNLFFCVDVSGSMAGDDKIGFVREALHTAVAHLRQGDHITLVTFDDSAHDVLLNAEVSASAATINNAIDALEPGTSTNMIAGLQRAYDLAQDNFDPQALQRVLLFGDGNANVGDTDIATFASLTRMNDQEGIYLSSVGVGLDFDWTRMDQLADAGKGASVFLPSDDEVQLIFGDYFDKLVEVAADEVSIELMLPAGITLSGFSGEETSIDPEAPVQRIILAAGDDMTFLARFDVADEAALEQPGKLTLRFVPLGTGEEIVAEYDLEHFGDLVTEAGPLLERTRAVETFARMAVGQASAEDVQLALGQCGESDLGLQEIGELAQ